jgi:hypothetical protein
MGLNLRWFTPPGYFLLFVMSIYIAATGSKAPLYYWPYVAVLLVAILAVHVLESVRPSNATHIASRTAEVVSACSGYAITIWLVYKRYHK